MLHLPLLYVLALGNALCSGSGLTFEPLQHVYIRDASTPSTAGTAVALHPRAAALRPRALQTDMPYQEKLLHQQSSLEIVENQPESLGHQPASARPSLTVQPEDMPLVDTRSYAPRTPHVHERT